MELMEHDINKLVGMIHMRDDSTNITRPMFPIFRDSSLSCDLLERPFRFHKLKKKYQNYNTEIHREPRNNNKKKILKTN
jgi:hypothetical protein